MENEITEGNKLIAEFMNYFLQGVQYAKRKGIEYDWRLDEVEIKSLKYHSSWDWLMPVVEKIEQIDIDNLSLTIEYHACRISHHGFGKHHFPGDSKIDATYKAVVQFIQWYNTKTKP